MRDHPDIDGNLMRRENPVKRALNSTTGSVTQMEVPLTGALGRVDMDESTSTQYTSEWVDKLVTVSREPCEQATVRALTDSGPTNLNEVFTQASVPVTLTPMNNAPKGQLPPSKKDFKVPSNRVEHDQMITDLISAGIAKDEAEQIINMRKNAFNKACRDIKKQNERADKKPTKPSKLASSKSKQNVN